MSIIPDACATALGILASAVGQTLQYRTTHTGSWSTLSGAFLQPGAPVVIGYDDRRSAILAPQTARLKVPTTGALLTPGAGNAEIKDQAGTVWSVVGIAIGVGQTIYELQRTVVQSSGPDRGAAP